MTARSTATLQLIALALSHSFVGAVPAAAYPVTPTAPSGVTATAVATSRINVTWVDRSRYEFGVSIERSRSPSTGFVVVAQVRKDVTAYSDAGLAAATTYYYRLRAIGWKGTFSAYSNVASATTLGASPPANQAPVANAGADRATQVSMPVPFSGAASFDPDGTIMSYAWSFGDGAMASGVTASHVYTRTGTYTAMLTVRDNGGSMDTDTATVQVLSAPATTTSTTPTPATTSTTLPPSPGASSWTRAFGDSLVDVGHSVAVDGNGNVIVAGQFMGSVDFGGGPLSSAGDSDIFLAKYSPAGSHMWSRRFGGSGRDVPGAVAVDGGGNVVIVGQFEGAANFGGGALSSAGSADIFVARYSPAGVHQWSRRFGGPNRDGAEAVSIDASGNMAVTGSFQGTADLGGGLLTSEFGSTAVFVAKYSAAGTHLWSRSFYSPSLSQGVAVAFDRTGDVFVAGRFRGIVDFGGGMLAAPLSTLPDGFLLKLSGAQGNHVWSRSFGGSGTDGGYALGVDSSGNVVMAGTVAGDSVDLGGGPIPLLNSDAFIAKYSSAGSHQWSKVLGAGGGDGATALAVSASGHVVVSGSFDYTVNFGGGPLTSRGLNDLFVAGYSSTGTHLWSRHFGSTGVEGSGGVAVGGNGSVVATGGFTGTADIGKERVTSKGSFDAFLLSLAP